ncbi:MAG: hypothetical protein PVS3B1_29900 [Ktedonobacteraceae bacterium]
MSIMNTSPDDNVAGPRRVGWTRRWTWWIAPKQFDLVSSLLYISMPLLSTYFATENGCRPLTGWQMTLMWLTVLALLSIDRFEYHLYGEQTPRIMAIMLLAVRIVLVELIAQLDSFHFSPFLYLTVPLLASLYFGIRVGYVFMLLAWLAFFVKASLFVPHWLQQSEHAHSLVIYTIGLIFAMTMAHAFLMERYSRSNAERFLQELEESHRQLQAYSEQVAELATTRERNRLARDIHDTLGHYLTVINVQLEKALAFREKHPQEAELAVSDAKRFASEALRDVRRSVSALRNIQEVQALVPSMAELVQRMRTEQRQVELSIEGSELGFSQQALLTLYHAAQEGLTNVQKHAEATRVTVTVRYNENEAILTLKDNGRGFNPAMLEELQQGREGGYGLQGLQERLQLVRGHLDIESRPGGGTFLSIRVPKRQYAGATDTNQHAGPARPVAV